MNFFSRMNLLFSKSKSKEKVYFTIDSNPEIGFTDHLYKFNTYYKLGKYLGFVYLHTPACSKRSSKKIFKFIGFNRYFNNGESIICSRLSKRMRILLSFCKYKNIFIRFHDNEASKLSLASFDDLIRYIRTLTSRNSRRPHLVRFSGRTLNYYKWIHSNIKCTDPPADLRTSYFNSRKLYPWKSKFQDNSIKILIHIRQGDTALIPTPWGKYITAKKIREIESTHLSEIRYTKPNDYFRILNLIIDEIRPRKYSIVVCSDGYKRTFKKIYKEKRRLNLTKNKVKQLKQLEFDFEDKMFCQFNGVSNCVSVIGESDSNLFDLIHSAILADLIIIGDQQSMLVKLMVNYADNLNPPIIVHLHNRKENLRNYGRTMGVTNLKIISINMNNIDKILLKQIAKELINK